MTITATLTTAQITIFAIVICVIELIKLILLIWLVSAFSKVKRYSRLHANRTGQLCKLTADTQILTRGIFKKLTENDVEEDYLPAPEEKPKKTRKKVSAETNE
jgi:hypothetical protein